jgi:Mn2+/Fe2+ NRAMP family transporter
MVPKSVYQIHFGAIGVPRLCICNIPGVVLVTVADVALVMVLEGRGFRWLEVFVILLILIIFAW